MKRTLKMELIKYLFTGGGAVLIDFSIYELLTVLMGWNPSISKGTSYIAGALFAFTLNKFWTFESDAPIRRAFVKFSVLYTLTFSANVGIHALFIRLLSLELFAFAIATFTSIVLNYIGQKFWVFKESVNGH